LLTQCWKTQDISLRDPVVIENEKKKVRAAACSGGWGVGVE
jgi:hypothetical protein